MKKRMKRGKCAYLLFREEIEGMREGSLVEWRCRETGAGTDLGVFRLEGRGVISTLVGDKPWGCRAC